jgi:hypothetical protein
LFNQNKEEEMRRLVPMLMCMLFLTTATFATASAKDVYVTKNGKKYHTETCRWVKGRETIKMAEEEAIKKGLTPCGKCMTEGEKK